MKFGRAIGGFLLSFIFLAIFAYMISGVQWVLKNSVQIPASTLPLESASLAVAVGSAENAVAENVPVPNSSNLEVNAEAAISVKTNFQGKSTNLFEKNINTPLPIASLTKLMTAVVVLDNYNLSDTAVVDKIADSQDSMKHDVVLGQTMSVENFLNIMLIESSNKSAYVLSEGPGGYPGEPAFVDLMNKKAKDVGLQDTFFVDPTGLSAGDVSTASDLVKLAEYILSNKKYSKISDVSKLRGLTIKGFGNVENTDELLAEIPDIICSKTGFTTAAKGCLLVAIGPTGLPSKNNDYLINVILGADDRFSEMRKMINWQTTACVGGN